MENSNKYLDFGKMVLSDVSSFYNSALSGSSNYGQRFVSFLVFTQLLYFLLCAVVWLFGWIGLASTIQIIILLFFGVGFVFLILFLFKGIKAKAASFFGSGILYFAISLFFAEIIGLGISIPDITFLGGWIFWNIVYSIVIMMIGTFRTLFLGFLYEYKKKDKMEHPPAQDAETTG